MTRTIALFMPMMSDGGGERVMLNLANGIAARDGYKVDLVLAKPSSSPRMAEVSSDVNVCVLDARHLSSSLPVVVRYLRKNRPDVLISALVSANIVAAWAKRLTRTKTRVIVSEHNVLSEQVRMKRDHNWKARVAPFFVSTAYGAADGIVAVSDGVADDLATYARISRDDIEVLPNPVITPDLLSRAEEPIDHEWFVDPSVPVVVGVGRLTAQKDFPTLLRALALVQREQTVRLVILGEGGDRPALEALVRELGLEDVVDLPGFVGNPYAYMARASLFVLSSRWEGMPTVLIEALCLGTRVVATDCPSGPSDLVEDASLVPMEDPEALAAAIRNALSGNGEHQSTVDVSRYTVEAAASRYLSYSFASNGDEAE